MAYGLGHRALKCINETYVGHQSPSTLTSGAVWGVKFKVWG